MTNPERSSAPRRVIELQVGEEEATPQGGRGDAVDAVDIEGILESAHGSPPRLMRWTFKLRGILDVQHARRLERRLMLVPSLHEARVDERLGKLVVSAVDFPHRREFIGALVAEEGASAVAEASPEDAERAPAEAKLRRSVRRLVALGAISLIPGLAHEFGLVSPGQGQDLAINAEVLLVLAAVLWGGGPLLLRTVTRTLRGRPSAEALPIFVALGLIVGNLAVFLSSGRAEPHFAPAVLLLVGTIALGERLRRTHDLTRGPSEAVSAMAPKDAWVVKGDALYALSASDVSSEDIVVVVGGMAVPADGVVVAGEAVLDERRVLVGQSSRRCAPGERLFAGRRILEGRIALRAVADARASSIARVAKLLDRLERADVWLQAKATAAGRWAAGGSIVAALGVFAWRWLSEGSAGSVSGGALHGAIGVLLATAVVAAARARAVSHPKLIASAVERGILFRDAGSLERVADLDELIFDKSGTVTAGRPTAGMWRVAPGEDRDGALGLLLGLTDEDDHPDSPALSALARAEMQDVNAAAEITGREALPGLGVRGQLRTGETVHLGNGHLMQQAGVAMAQDAHPWLAAFEAAEADASAGGDKSCGSHVYLARGSELIARFDLRDEPRPDARRVMESLAAGGLELALISPDGDTSLEVTGERLGIPHVQGALGGEAAAAWVAERRRHRSRRVGMVTGPGAGVAARRAADTGVVFGTGLGLGRLTDDLTIMPEELSRLLDARALAFEARRRIRRAQELIALQTIAVTALAALGMLPLGAAAAAGLGITVITSSLGARPAPRPNNDVA
ncbi:MAG: HAD family hydrolase [Myxococcota bacterium]